MTECSSEENITFKSGFDSLQIGGIFRAFENARNLKDTELNSFIKENISGENTFIFIYFISDNTT